jgi:hypothetical protein
MISDWDDEYGGLKAGRRMMSLGKLPFRLPLLKIFIIDK